MDEIRNNQKVKIKLRDNSQLEGVILDYIHDRVMVLINDEYIQIAKSIKELDEVMVFVDTHLGVKSMKSDVISELNKQNCIIIENTVALPVDQKREHVRVNCDFNFPVFKNKFRIPAHAQNISGGGIAFDIILEGKSLERNDLITVRFSKDVLGCDLTCSANIIKANGNNYVAQFCDLKPFQEEKIVKYVFNLMSKK